MKLYSLILLAAALGVSGCTGTGQNEDNLPVQAAPTTPTSVDITLPATKTELPIATGTVGPDNTVEAALPQLAPVQQGIAAFKAKNNRLPNNVEEMVEGKILTALPQLPPGKIYYIDHATGRVHISSGP